MQKISGFFAGLPIKLELFRFPNSPEKCAINIAYIVAQPPRKFILYATLKISMESTEEIENRNEEMAAH